jgi:hypothetical protein
VSEDRLLRPIENDYSRRLLLMDMTGRPQPDYGVIDLTGVPNADATAPWQYVVQQRCDMGHWHNIGHGELANWDHRRSGK